MGFFLAFGVFYLIYDTEGEHSYPCANILATRALLGKEGEQMLCVVLAGICRG